MTRLAVKGGWEFQLNVDDRCGNVTEFVSTSCTEEPLNTISRRLSNNTFRVTVTGLKTDQDCVMIQAITDNGISSIYSILKIPVEGEYCDPVLCQPHQGAFLLVQARWWRIIRWLSLLFLSLSRRLYSLLWLSLSFINSGGNGGTGIQVKM